jgi:uncharacterized repeat protein (TIGR01451 family)
MGVIARRVGREDERRSLLEGHMKRFVIATASALFLIAGNAFASVPGGPTPGSGAGNPSSATAVGASQATPPSAASAGVAPLTSGVLTGIFADPDLGLPGLPGGASQLLGSVDPVLSGVAGAIPAPVAGLVPAPVAGLVPAPLAGALPALTGPAPVPPPGVPGVTPPPPSSSPPSGSKTPPAKRHASASARRISPKAVQAAAAAALFQGLPPTGYAGYGTASVIHTDLLQVGTQRLENLDAAFSGAAFSSAPLAQPTTNEMARIVAPALSAGNAYGRGSGLEVGLAIDQSGQNQIIPGSIAEAKAPPSTGLVTKEVGPVNVNPLVGADLLRGQAQGLANAACTTGVDLSYGLGYAANLGLVGTPGSPTLSTTASTPDRSVSQSRSHTFLVPQSGSSSPIRKFGLASETRETIAPITFFKGSPQQFTLEFAGEWVLRTTSDGNTGTVFYGPGNVTPDTPLLRILDAGGNVMSNIPEITTQTLFGPTGLNVNIPNVANISIGGPPRMIGGSADSKPVQTATMTAAAVDVVSVQLLQGTVRLADVRVGHMENATAVPAGGITCGIGLVKKSDKDVVTPGQDFTWTVSVSNPNDCVLQQVKVVDSITADTPIVWTVDNATPSADQKANSGVTWNDVGPLNPGASKDLMIHVIVSPSSGGGKFLDNAVATGVCGPAAGTAGAGAAVGVPLEAKVSLSLPEVNAALGALLPRELPRTGGALAVLPALALTGGGLALRRSAKRKRRKA